MDGSIVMYILIVTIDCLYYGCNFHKVRACSNNAYYFNLSIFHMPIVLPMISICLISLTDQISNIYYCKLIIEIILLTILFKAKLLVCEKPDVRSLWVNIIFLWISSTLSIRVNLPVCARYLSTAPGLPLNILYTGTELPHKKCYPNIF